MASSGCRREKYLQSLYIDRVTDERYVDLPRPGPVLQMILTNLRNRPLKAANVKSMFKLLLSLYHSLVTGSKDFPVIECEGSVKFIRIDSPFGLQAQNENTRPSPLMDGPAGLIVPAPGSSSSSPNILTPVLPEKVELGELKADPRNRVFNVKCGGTAFTRVISTVYCSEDTELTNRWRVTDYSAAGHALMSVLCQFTRTSARCAVPSKQKKRKHTEEESSSSSSQSPPKKRMIL